MGKNPQLKKTNSGGILKSSVTREFSSGGVVFKKDRNKILWLVRKTTASKLYPKQYWMLPKGRIDDTKGDKPGPMASGKIRASEESLRSAAIREVGEEGGVQAAIIKKIGTSIYSFTDPKVGKVVKFVTFYLMRYEHDLPGGHDWETSEVKWLEFDEIQSQLSFSDEKKTLAKAQEILASVA